MASDTQFAYVYHTFPEGFREDSLNENEFCGSTHEAIQKAIDYIHAKGGGEVRISYGTYKICGTISTGSSTTGGVNALKMYSDITLTGNCTLGSEPGSCATVFTSASNEENSAIISIYGSDATPISNVLIRRIKFDGVVGVDSDGNAVYCASAIYMKYGKDCTIHQCEFRNFDKYACRIEDSNIIDLTDAYLDDNEAAVSCVNARVIGTHCNIKNATSRPLGWEIIDSYVKIIDSVMKYIVTGIRVSERSTCWITRSHIGYIASAAVDQDGGRLIIENMESTAYYGLDIIPTMIKANNLTSAKINKARSVNMRLAIITNSKSVRMMNVHFSTNNHSVIDPDLDVDAIRISNCSGCLIGGLMIEHATNGIVIDTGTTYSSIFDLATLDCKSKGISLNNSHFIIINGVDSVETEYGIHLQNSTYVSITGATYKNVEYRGEGNVCDSTLNNQVT